MSERGGFVTRQAPETRTHSVLLSLADTLTSGALCGACAARWALPQSLVNC